jgi:FAD/FMN-containing dehydrogenase
MPSSSPLSPSVLNALRAAVGDAHVLTAQAGNDLAVFERDWRGRSQGRALAVVRPAHAAEVAAVVRICADAKRAGHPLSLVPQGGNTGLVMGSTPDDTGTQIVLSFSRLNRVRELDAANATLTVEAGCVLQQVQQVADAAGFLFALSLAAEGSCQIGGNLATNAGGTAVLRYGNARDLCLGLEVVTAQGEVWNGLTGLRKDNTGYDLRHLMIGSEGTLGLITAATLRLHPKPRAQLTAWAAVPSLEAAVQLLGLAQAHLASELTGFEVMNETSLRLVAEQFAQQRLPLTPQPFHVLLESSDFESDAHAQARFETLMQTALDAGCVSDAAVAQNSAQARAMWHIRESIPLAQAALGLNIKHDISLPVSRIAAFCAAADATLQRAVPGVRLVNFGHLGDGNLHYNVQCPDGADGQRFLAEHEGLVNRIVYDAVAAQGGSISAEHGVGALKRDLLPAYKSPVALAMMRSIKQVLDPLGLLNPGRVVG